MRGVMTKDKDFACAVTVDVGFYSCLIAITIFGKKRGTSKCLEYLTYMDYVFPYQFQRMVFIDVLYGFQAFFLHDDGFPVLFLYSRSYIGFATIGVLKLLSILVIVDNIGFWNAARSAA